MALEATSPSDPTSYYETVRVNLSTGGRCVVAYLKFQRGMSGSKDAAAELLTAFVPRS